MTSLTLLGGLILGLVSSLHCVAMCGGLGGTLSISLGRSTAFPDRARALAMAQVGKMVAYVAAGAVVGGFGSTLYGLFDQHAAYAVLQRFGALVLVWTAISLTGLLPSPASLGRAFAPLSRWAWAERRLCRLDVCHAGWRRPPRGPRHAGFCPGRVTAPDSIITGRGMA